MRLMGNHRVKVAQQKQTARAASGEPSDEVGRATPRRAGHPLHLGPLRQEGHTYGGSFLSPADVA